VEFSVGRDFGIGENLTSKISAGIRGAELEATNSWAANAQTDWVVPEGWGFPGFLSSYKRQHVVADAERKFRGAGPVLSWDGGMGVWGDEHTGRLKVDWSATGGALYGERKTVIHGQTSSELHQGNVGLITNVLPDRTVVTGFLPQLGDPIVTPFGIASRTEDATVPVVDLSLGLSYDIGRINVGAGYRWERYFNALDVGFTEAKDGDRTIDGPYFKIAVGFGG